MSDEVSLLQAFSRSSHPGRNGSQRDTVVVVGPRVRPEGLNRPQRTRRRFYYKKYRSYSGRQRLQELVGNSLYIDLRLYLFQCHVESRSYDWTAFVPPRGGTRLPLLLGPGQVSGRLTKTVSPMGLYQGTWLLSRAGQLAVASSGYYRSTRNRRGRSRGGRGCSRNTVLVYAWRVR